MVYWHSSRMEVRTVTNAAAGNPQAATATLTNNVWTHFAWTYDGSTHTLYLNGVASSNSTNGSNVGIDGNNYLARRQAGNYFHGDIDDVRIYDRALTSAELGSLVNGGSEPATVELTEKWLPIP
jgi:hypothetical protein